jgi:polyhydroxyalkanoate synthase
LQGARNLANDIVNKQSLPAQVKPGQFVVGENLAMTPGAVVFRNEMLELLQYQPTTPKVRRIPTLMIVPPIGKYYFMDLAPKRSFTEFAVAQNTQFFTTSWRNPQAEHGDWGLDEYVQSCLAAVDAVCEITGSRKVNLLGLCAGGIIATLMLSYMARRKDRRINAAAFGVMLLDFASRNAHRRVQVRGPAQPRAASLAEQGHPAGQQPVERLCVDAPQRPDLELLGQ